MDPSGKGPFEFRPPGTKPQSEAGAARRDGELPAGPPPRLHGQRGSIYEYMNKEVHAHILYTYLYNMVIYFYLQTYLITYIELYKLYIYIYLHIFIHLQKCVYMDIELPFKNVRVYAYIVVYCHRDVLWARGMGRFFLEHDLKHSGPPALYVVCNGVAIFCLVLAVLLDVEVWVPLLCRSLPPLDLTKT